MKPFIIFMMLCSLTGCATRSPVLPPVSGNAEPVNSPSIMQEIGHVAE